MRFNDMGLRDKYYSPKATRGVYRILVLGSSNTLGPGMEEEKIFPRQLEKALRSLGRKNVEVINGAMVGYCSVQTSFRLVQLLERYSPDLVLFQWVQGACPLFDGAWGGRVIFEGGEPKRIDRAPFGAGRLQALNQFVFERPSLFYLWLTAADQWRKAVFSRHYSAPPKKEQRVRRYLEPTLAILKLMKEKAKRAEAGFVVVSYQMKPFTQSVPASMHRWLASLLSVLVVPIDFSHLEMFAMLKEEGIDLIYLPERTRKLLVPGDMHLSEEGARRLAESTASMLAPSIPMRARSQR